VKPQAKQLPWTLRRGEGGLERDGDSSSQLRKGDHIYVEGTLVSSTFEKEFGKGKSKITVPFKAWQVKADSIRMLSRTKKDQAPNQVPVDSQPADIPF
jgi:single-stranded DNA-binding protein